MVGGSVCGRAYSSRAAMKKVATGMRQKRTMHAYGKWGQPVL